MLKLLLAARIRETTDFREAQGAASEMPLRIFLRRGHKTAV
jgi:hypothetical protein